MRYLLDTNICIYIAKQRPASVLAKFEELSVSDVGMSVITYGELWYGVQKSQFSQKNQTVLENLTSLIPPISLPITAGCHYGEIRRLLECRGQSLGGNDLWVAAHALAASLILVTNNSSEFARIPQLALENWIS